MFTRLQNLSNRAVLLILFLLFAGGSLWSLLINLTKPNGDFAEWGESWLQNFSTEMFGAFLTFMLLTLIVSSRQEKERLIRQLGSKVSEVTLQAAEELRARGWLQDGSLQMANLVGANLQGASLWGADLQGANLVGANLQGAILNYAKLQEADLSYAKLQGADLSYANLQEAGLSDAKLQGADLSYANLQEANLRRTDLQEADLRGANLQEADLRDANLQGANLRDAKLQGADLRDANLQGANLGRAALQEADLWNTNLQGANLTGTIFGKKTVLPSGRSTRLDDNHKPIYTSESYYHPDVTVMARYTDPNHPNFWQPWRVKKQQASDSSGE